MTDQHDSAHESHGPSADEVPGQEGYQGRHSRPGEGDGVPTPEGGAEVPGVPGGWPATEEDPVTRPTSPIHGAASEAAARAAYEDSPKASPEARAAAEEHAAKAAADAEGRIEEDVPVEEAPPVTGVETPEPAATGGGDDATLAAERLADLQRLQAEYVNYKRRVDRDRALDRDRAVGGVIEAMLPVLDEIHLARQHGELEGGPFEKIATKLEGVLGRYGVERYGESGEAFDPQVHEAVMHTQADLPAGTTDTTVVQVMQPGFRMNGRVLRAALVAVADPA